MTKRLMMIILFWAAAGMPGLAQVAFEDHFVDKAMRVDLFHVGDAKDEIVTIDYIYQEGIWPESRAHLNDKVGVFEGAGYAAKGLYRPMVYCLMISNSKDEFCLVCQRAIGRMIDYFSGGH